MTTPQPVRFPTAILLVGAGYGFLAALQAGFAQMRTLGGSMEDGLIFLLSIVVWALSVLYWHGLALVSWRLRPAIVTAVIVPSVLLALVLGYLNDCFVQMLCTQVGLIGSALVTGTLTRSEQSAAKRWMYGAAVSVIATGIWLMADYERIESILLGPESTVSVALSGDASERSQFADSLGALGSRTDKLTDTSTGASTLNTSDSLDIFGFDSRALYERLLPGSLVISEIAPVAVGGVLFARSVSALQGFGALLPSLRIPFGLMPVLTAALTARLMFGEPIARIADNLIFVMALVYLVGGIALVSFVMSRFGWSVLIRLAVWMALVLFAVYLLPALIFAGLIDSFLDLRSRLAPPAEPLSS